MPKAKPFPIGDEDEKTTTDDSRSQWEDEASTTVEQGDVAEKIRSLGADTPRRTITNITNTGATGLDESTVDDQHADPMLAITPVPRDEVAQLVVAQGNDLGQVLAVQPGKTYTIGRAIDNDLVLTDIAVSRKHFELRHEDGAWVIADRGSGNGTVVNGNIEDNPFMLANGDLVEIGNTIFRFEQPNGVSRRQPGFDIDVDEEMSTVAGKAMHTDPIEAATPVEQPLRPLAPGPASRQRAKTLPPPTPLRPLSPSAPPMSYAPPQPMPATTLPMQQMSNRAPVLPPQSPTMLGADAMSMPLPGVMPTTLPGQGMQRGGLQRPQQYPVTNDIPPHSVHAQMLKIAANAGRSDPSTAHVSPTPFGALGLSPPGPVSGYAPQQLSKRTKYAIGAAGLSVLAAILTIAILKSGSAKSTPMSAAAGDSPAGSAALKVEPIKPPVAEDTPKPETPRPPDQKLANIEQPRQPTPAPTARPETPKAPEQRVEQRPKRQEPAPRRRERTQPQASPTPPSPPAEARQPAPRRVATADTAEARKASDTAYALKNFAQAANILYAASRSADAAEAQQLRHRAENIDRFARLYSSGMAPAATQIEQFEKLRSAEPLDQVLGNVFNAEIETKLAQVSSKAALSYMGLHQYENALKAVERSESLGVSNGNTRIVRATLDNNAQSLYSEASREAESNPSAAKDKLHKLLQFIDPKSAYYDKTNKLLKKLER
ncbi:MAG: FHA domain-containing protein [Acidobacteriota bacterium]